MMQENGVMLFMPGQYIYIYKGYLLWVGAPFEAHVLLYFLHTYIIS